MTRRYPPREDIASVLTGRRLSRRTFLRVLALSGIAAATLPGAARAAMRPDQAEGQALAQLRADPISDLAAALMYDVEAIHAFVRDRIRYEPYVGYLRGPHGTLAAGAGNSVDQAALLGALLDASLVPFRFAHGPLEEELQQVLLARAAEDTAFVAAMSVAGPEAATAPAVDGPVVDETLSLAAASRETVLGWARTRLTETLATIEEALQGIGLELGQAPASLPRHEIDEHYWIQLASGAEWVDLDPTLAGTGPARATATPAAVPDELRHVVELSVLGERALGDDVRTETLLTVVSTADRLAGVPITFLNADPTGVARLSEAVTPVAGSRAYVPTIALGDEAFGGTPIHFATSGTLASDLLDGGPVLSGGATGETTAQWLDLTVRSPAREPVHVRRTIFDRFGSSVRDGGRLDVGALPAAREISLAEGSTEVLDASGAIWLSVSVGLPERGAPMLSGQPQDLGSPAVYALGQSVVRESSDRALGVPLGIRTFQDAPNVVAMTLRPTVGHEDEEVSLRADLDIWHSSRAVAPVDDRAPELPPATASGILDHLAERIVMGDAPIAGAASDRPVSVSVGSIFEQARRDDVGFVAISRPGDVDTLELPAEVASALRTAMADPSVVAVLPRRPVATADGARVGWWLVDVATGGTLDVLDTGGSNTEYQVTLLPAELAQQSLAQKLGRECLAAGVSLLAVFIGAYVADKAAHYQDPGLAIAAWAVMTGGGTGAGTVGFRCVRGLGL